MIFFSFAFLTDRSLTLFFDDILIIVGVAAVLAIITAYKNKKAGYFFWRSLILSFLAFSGIIFLVLKMFSS